jgi:hypothetical protein
MAHPDLATRVLVLGGVFNLVLSFVLGFVLSDKRRKDPIEKHRWLLTAHVVSLEEGVMLLALAFALGYARLPGAAATAGAVLLVVASAFQDFSGVINWLRNTKDQFAEKSAGWILASVNAVLNTIGLAIVTVGVVRGVL